MVNHFPAFASRRKKMSNKVIHWFTNDLRLDDNPAFVQSSRLADEIACIYIIDAAWFKKSRFQSTAMGHIRFNFLKQSLNDLDNQLNLYNQSLHILYGNPVTVITGLIETYAVTHVCRSTLADYNLNQVWQALVNKHRDIVFTRYATHTLYKRSELPFDIQALPDTFTGFRKMVELQNVRPPIDRPTKLPGEMSITSKTFYPPFDTNHAESSKFQGGAANARNQLDYYFNGGNPQVYFEVRNSLDGWDNSTKFSPWLANGSLSARTIMAALNNYESTTVKNKSTYWIYFELLWREYFQWYAHKYNARLFGFSGIKKQAPLTSFYAERFKKWCHGSTPYAIVNACMNELNSTGYLSNRGRQIVASCFINELELDWRFGAAYFEQQLIDYDVANNWGNWQYLAGVGADPQQKRHFNIDKQTRQFDPSGFYINKWTTTSTLTELDSVDAADWPLE